MSEGRGVDDESAVVALVPRARQLRNGIKIRARVLALPNSERLIKIMQSPIARIRCLKGAWDDRVCFSDLHVGEFRMGHIVDIDIRDVDTVCA